MRFVLVAVVAALLAAPVAAQHRGRRPHTGVRLHSGYRAHLPAACLPSRPYGYRPYRHYSAYGPSTHGNYPGSGVDLGLATFLARQQQDFRTDALPYGWTPYDHYGFDIRAPRGYGREYDSYEPRRDYERDEERSSYGADFGRDRSREGRYVAPKPPVKIRASVVDGVPTLVSDN